MSNPNIVSIGVATRWKPGQSPNPGGRPKLSITQKVRDLLARDSDLFDAVQVLEAAGESLDTWTAERLQNADLVAMAILGIALNRTGRVPYAVQLQALSLIWDRMNGKVGDKGTKAALVDDESQRPLMSIQDFREAIRSVPSETEVDARQAGL